MLRWGQRRDSNPRSRLMRPVWCHLQILCCVQRLPDEAEGCGLRHPSLRGKEVVYGNPLFWPNVIVCEETAFWEECRYEQILQAVL